MRNLCKSLRMHKLSTSGPSASSCEKATGVPCRSMKAEITLPSFSGLTTVLNSSLLSSCGVSEHFAERCIYRLLLQAIELMLKVARTRCSPLFQAAVVFRPTW